MTTIDSVHIGDIVKEPLRSLGFELWGNEFVKENGSNTLRIYIYNKQRQINLEDCAVCSRYLGPILDAETDIEQNYVLEVSSTGLEKTFFNLEQMKDYIGEKIAIKFLDKIKDRNRVKGTLNRIEADKLYVDANDELFEIPYTKVKKAKLIVY